MENLIEKINKKGQEVRNEKIQKTLSEKESFDKKLDEIKKLGGRISKMWDIAQALLDNGFRIGKAVPSYGPTPDYTLETDCSHHWIGFCVNNGQILWFGVAGGGCCGASFEIDKSGECLLDKNRLYGRFYRYFEDGNNKRHCDKILNGFDEYERKFYEYVENLVG